MEILNQKLANLVQAYLSAWHKGEFDDDPDEVRYHDLIKERHEWLRENILDLEKLRGYTEAEFEQKFYEMIGHTEGSNSIHARTKGVFKKCNPDIKTIRTQFENIIAFITSPRVDRFAALEKVEDKNGEYNIKGLGHNTLTALMNAQYPDVPIVNNVTEIFFKSIDQELPKNITDKQRVVHEIFAEMVKSANGEIDFIDANHVCWYTQKVDSGIDFMKVNFPATYIAPATEPRKTTSRRKRPLTPEEMRAEAIARLQAVHDQAQR